MKNIPFDRTPKAAVKIWQQRIADTIENQMVFTLLCHPINLTIKFNKCSDLPEEFLFPVIRHLGRLHQDRRAWVCTCNQLAGFYWSIMKK